MKTSPGSAAEVIARLAACGIRLRPGLGPEDLAAAGHDAGEPPPPWADPWESALAVIGELSDDVLTWYTECIEGPGSYEFFLEELCRIAKGELPLEDLEGRVGPGGAWVEFTLDGARHHLDLVLDGDWLDESLVHRLGALLEARGSKLRLGACSHGQALVLVCVPRERFAALEALTGLELALPGVG